MNLFALTNLGTTLCPEALYPLAEPLPPDSAGVAGVESTGLTTEPTACLLEGEGGLRRGKAIKIKHNTPEEYNPYSPVTTPSRSDAPFPRLIRINGRLIRRPIPDVRRRSTGRGTYTPETTIIS